MDNRRFSEKLLAVVKSAGVVILLTFFFYRSLWAMLPLSVVGFLFYKKLQREDIKKRKHFLEEQFKECILSVASSMKAGYAIENAFMESMTDMRRLYGNESMIVCEIEVIKRGLEMNVPLETLLEDLSKRSHSAHIEQFAQVFIIAKHGGGNMPEIIKTSAELIGRDMDSREEIRTILSGRRMEQNVMKFMPFVIVLYISITSKGYFNGMYGNLTGSLIMTGCLVVYICAYCFGEKVLSRLESAW